MKRFGAACSRLWFPEQSPLRCQPVRHSPLSLSRSSFADVAWSDALAVLVTSILNTRLPLDAPFVAKHTLSTPPANLQAVCPSLGVRDINLATALAVSIHAASSSSVASASVKFGTAVFTLISKYPELCTDATRKKILFAISDNLTSFLKRSCLNALNKL